LWDGIRKTWFTEGKDDPGITVIKVTVIKNMISITIRYLMYEYFALNKQLPAKGQICRPIIGIKNNSGREKNLLSVLLKASCNEVQRDLFATDAIKYPNVPSLSANNI
jgi:hypothetical protein